MKRVFCLFVLLGVCSAPRRDQGAFDGANTDDFLFVQDVVCEQVDNSLTCLMDGLEKGVSSAGNSGFFAQGMGNSWVPPARSNCEHTSWAQGGGVTTLEDYPDCRHLLDYYIGPPQPVEGIVFLVHPESK